MGEALPESSDRHLDEDEIELLLWCRKRDRGDSVDNTLEDAWGERHIATCTRCGRLLEAREKGQMAMEEALKTNSRRPGPNCPSFAIWPLVAAGAVDSSELAEHAADCDWCGILLRQAMRDITADPSEEEQEAVRRLPSSEPGMARIIADRLSTQAAACAGRRTGVAPFPLRRNLWIGLVAASVAVGVVAYWFTLGGRDPNRLLEQAYSANRTMEWRMRGAQHASVHLSRGRSAAELESMTPQLLRAEAVIAEHLVSNPNDPHWMTAKGRADLLTWRCDSAIGQFRRVLEVEPESEIALVDLAGAYFERAEATGRDLDYGTAIDLLGRALQKSPNDPIALFNRALVSERMYLYRQAVTDWEALLKNEQRGGWADEARARLSELKKKVNGN
jgi:tetratricopeptide (TPR) repeat protein